MSTLFEAIHEGADAVVRALRAGASPETADEEGETALYRAAVANEPGVVRLLLAAGADPGRAGGAEAGDLPLCGAACGGHAEVVRALLAAGAVADQPEAYGFTALDWAVRLGHAETVRVLLEHGAAPSRPGPDGLPPLVAAARRGSTASVRALLEFGAGPAEDALREARRWIGVDIEEELRRGLLAAGDSVAGQAGAPDPGQGEASDPGQGEASGWGGEQGDETGSGTGHSEGTGSGAGRGDGAGSGTGQGEASGWGAGQGEGTGPGAGHGHGAGPGAGRGHGAGPGAGDGGAGPEVVVRRVREDGGVTVVVEVLREDGVPSRGNEQQTGHAAIATLLERALGVRVPPEELAARALRCGEPDLDDWKEAVRTLGARDDEESFRAASGWCASPDPLRRALGARVLGALDSFTPRGLPVLRGLAARTAKAALGEGPTTPGAAREPALSVVVALGQYGEEAALPELLGLAAHPDIEVRRALGCALTGPVPAGDAVAVATLVALSRDHDHGVRDWATLALAEVPEDTPLLREALAARLADDDEDVVAEAARGLAMRQDPRAVEVLASILADGDPDGAARDTALAAVEYVEDPRVRTRLEWTAPRCR
ncbi:ankyrin repeat domain-containing protein [Streptomyces sp. NPDC047981]|uniref:ankyrin repeat domain-containing protein n=1 Tax=Streptomyces sp. NPDC047981 TaxID=3154610 RepID=UPI00344840E8